MINDVPARVGEIATDQAAITEAQSKAAGVFPADLARVLISTEEADWKAIRWIQAPVAETFISLLHQLGERLLLIKE